MFAILSLKPKYAKAIFDGTKKYEYRKVRFSRDVHYLIIYATSPVGKLVGWFSIKGVEAGSPNEIWERTSKDAGISYDEFEDYYKGSTRAISIRIQDVHRFENPIDPKEKQVDFTIPQSFRYLTEGDRQFLSENLDSQSVRIRDSLYNTTPEIQR